jgi:hypothetical protein
MKQVHTQASKSTTKKLARQPFAKAHPLEYEQAVDNRLNEIGKYIFLAAV